MFFYIISVVILVLFIFLVYVSHKMTKPERMIEDWTPEDKDLEFEEVSFKTVDDVVIKGWWIDKGNDKTVIGLHGYTSSKWYDVYMKPLLDILKDEDYNVLYFDFRAHGESGGNRTTIGEKELLDLEAAVDWLKGNHDGKSKRIGLIGYSMGAMIALKGLAVDERIYCGISDSPPLDLDATSARSMRYFAGLPSIFYYLTKPIGILLFGIDTKSMYSYAEEIDKPLLLIGGKNDPIVDVSEVKEFYEQNRKKNDHVEIWTTDAAHVRSLQKDTKEYKEKIISFLNNNI